MHHQKMMEMEYNNWNTIWDIDPALEYPTIQTKDNTSEEQ